MEEESLELLAAFRERFPLFLGSYLLKKRMYG